METARIPHIPESAPFTIEQRAWLNGFLAGLFSHVPAGNESGMGGLPPTASEPLTIMFGSQTGTAENLAKKLAKESERRGFKPLVLPLDDYRKATLTEAKKLVVISRTRGDGEPPDNATAFWAWLNSAEAPRLEQLQFAVLGLGDRNYADFCGASKKFDLRFEQLGATRMVPRGECDVDYEGPAKTWIEGLWPMLQSGNPALSPAFPSSNEPKAFEKLNGATHETISKYSRANPFPAPVLKNLLLSKPGSAKEVRHYELSLRGSGLVYQAGDALGVEPTNCPELVEAILGTIRNPDEQIEISDKRITLRESLLSHFDIMRPSQDLLAAVAKASPGCELGSLLKPERSADLKNWLWGRDVLDLLQLLTAPFTSHELVPLLRKLAPRLYSISSSPKAHPDEVHLTVSTVRYESFGRGRKGITSCFLADRSSTGPVRVFVQSAPNFKPPARTDAPMIMVGPGTGIAPFRAFLEEREAAGAKGKNWLFFGEQKYATDFFYEEQITGWLKKGHLASVDLAFSRDQENKIYVQHRLMEKAAELWKWLEEGAHFYVCGDASKMAADVDRALHQAIEKAGQKTPAQAADYISNLKSEKRYQRDVY